MRDLEEARSFLSRTDIISDQVRYNLLQREIERELLPYCKKEGIGVLAWSPIGKGVLAGKYHANARPKDPIRSEDDLFRPQNLKAAAPVVKLLRALGKTHGKTPAQVALSWVKQHRGVVPIPGVKRPAQSEENAGAAGWSLTAVEFRALNRASSRVRLDTF
jgi:aryl-alcohol dehydrogenase-like predicted oxidoreductase